MLFDRILTGLVVHGQVLEAIALYLTLSIEDVLDHIVRLGLPTPSDRPMRKAGGKRPWTVDEVRLLIDRWSSNLATASIAELIGRSPGGIRSKARRLGMFRRDRRELVRVAVLCPAARPLASPETPVDGAEEPATANARPKRSKRIRWNDAIDTQIAKRWFAHQHHKGIARDLGLTEGQVRTRATRMGLPARRDRKLIVQDYVEGRTYDTALEESVVKRRCREGNMTFYGPRNGPHTSPKVRQTKRYQELRRSIPDAMLHL